MRALCIAIEREVVTKLSEELYTRVLIDSKKCNEACSKLATAPALHVEQY